MASLMFAPDAVALVTGASSGIGRAIAHQLVSDGIRSIALLDISPDLPEQEAALKEAYPQVQTLSVSVDVANEAGVDLAIAKTVEEFGRIDVAVHAAGVGGGVGPTAELESKELDRILDINMKGVWFCERAVLRQMLTQELRDATTGLPVRVRGSIVNVGSIYSLRALPTVGPYTMAKHAVLGMTKVDGIGYATQGIRINCVCPGFVRTNLNGGKGWDSKGMEACIERTPAKRFGLAEEIAYTVSFLASDRASYITGTSIAVDGGYTAA